LCRKGVAMSSTWAVFTSSVLVERGCHGLIFVTIIICN
jgi:hypothetical protein